MPDQSTDINRRSGPNRVTNTRASQYARSGSNIEAHGRLPKADVIGEILKQIRELSTPNDILRVYSEILKKVHGSDLVSIHAAAKLIGIDQNSLRGEFKAKRITGHLTSGKNQKVSLADCIEIFPDGRRPVGYPNK